MEEPLRVAVVTGAGSGIGRQSAQAFIDAGYHVALAGRREDALHASVADAGRASRALVVPTDVSDPAAVDALFARVGGEWGRVDVLFNNAGMFGTPAPLDEVPFEEWQAIVATNVTGMFLCAQAAFRMMKRQEPGGGRIINNGSIAAHAPRPNRIGYTTTKHAVTGLTKALSLEGREFRIACGQVDIGNADTSTVGALRGDPRASRTPSAEPMMDVAEAADAVLYMASLPLETNVLFLTVMATNMPYIGRG